MKESVLDILIYLFENYMDAAEDHPQPDRELLREELERAGFDEAEVARALLWMDELNATRPAAPVSGAASRALRVFNSKEQARLDTDCRGFLLHLEHIGILSPAQRELVIDRLMALDAGDIDIEQLKWVVLMVIFIQPGQDQAFARMQDLVFEERADALH
jgi:Smg protein